MDVRIESEEPMGRDLHKSKLRRPNGPPVPSSAAVADQTGRVLSECEPEWLERLVNDPASFATIEREVHEQARRQADLYVAGLLAKVSARPERLMCPDWWLNTALVGSAVRTLTESPGNQGVANRVGTVRTADPTGFH